MNERELAGQCFMVGFPAAGPDPELVGMLERGEVGGAILFARNAVDGPGFRAAIAGLRRGARGWPLVALDQEGGAVLRVTRGASDLPAAMALGASGDLELTRAVGRAAGAELAAMGADLDLAPVLDVNRLIQNPGIGVRAFGTDAATVARFGCAWAKGLAEAGALGCAKHFPGKGASALDAHLALPTVPVSRAELDAHDLPPFKAAIEAGVPFLMTSHVIYPALDPERPATFSAAACRLARETLGFTGVLISDDLEMGALAELGRPEDHALQAIEAGHDLVLVCHRRELHLAMLERLVAAMRERPAVAARVREAAGRVRAAQAAAAGMARPRLESLVEEHAGLIARAHRAGIRVVRGEPRLEPGGTWRVYTPRLTGLTMVEEGTDAAGLLVGGLRRHLARVTVVEYDPKDPQVDPPAPGEAVLFLSYNAHLLEKQGALVRRLAGGDGAFHLVALRNPFDLELAPGARLAVAAHGFRRGVQAALVERLTGGGPA